jgi:hypothetical protein
VTIKNPPVMGYVRQANIGHGPQQVNNASATPDGAPRAGENPNLQNKLLEEKMANGWTPKRRARQAELIRQWRPWAKSTRPKTEAGKAAVSRNADKGGTWRLLRELSRALQEQKRRLKPATEDSVRKIWS